MVIICSISNQAKAKLVSWMILLMPMLSNDNNILLLKEAVKLHQFSSKFWYLAQGILKVVLYTGLNLLRESCRGSSFVANSFLVCYNWSQNKIYFIYQLGFPVTFIKVSPLRIQSNIIWWWIEIKEST